MPEDFLKMKTFFPVLLLIFSLTAKAQLTDYPLFVNVPYFVDTASNEIEYYGNSNLDSFFDTLVKFQLRGQGRYNIVHFGGSHLQAAIYTERLKKRFDEQFPGIIRGVGYVFPFSIAKTNHPVYYRSTYTGNWHYCKNVKKKEGCVLGVGGIEATTSDSVSSVKIYPILNPSFFAFDKVTLMCKVSDSSSFLVNINGKDTVLKGGYSIITLDFDDLQDTLKASFIKNDTLPNSSFTIYGFILDKNAPGLLYSSIGINGAATYSFLKCENFEKELALLNPDMLILSLGTNDAYGKGYSDSVYYRNIDSLVQIARHINPECKIILTVPNDDYYKRRYPNRNTAKQEKTIKKIAADRNLMVWDVFKFMGGLGSSQVWYRHGLMKYDRIHFTPQGYRLKGDLFFAAFMKRFDEYLSRQYKITLNGNFKKVF